MFENWHVIHQVHLITLKSYPRHFEGVLHLSLFFQKYLLCHPKHLSSVVDEYHFINESFSQIRWDGCKFLFTDLAKIWFLNFDLSNSCFYLELLLKCCLEKRNFAQSFFVFMRENEEFAVIVMFSSIVKYSIDFMYCML